MREQVMSIEGVSALVTGGVSGIGLCCVQELLRCGAKHVAICDSDDVKGAKVLADLAKEFGRERVIFIHTDVTKAGDLEAAFEQAVSKFHGLDIVLCGAGILNDVNWELEVSVNFDAMIRCTILALQYMGKNKGGRGGILCSTSSIYGLRPCASLPIYTATKYGIIGLCRSFGDPFHFERTGVRVVALCPGLTTTPLSTDVHRRLMDIDWLPSLTAEVQQLPVQTAEKVAVGVMTLIREADNGSVWVTEGENPIYEVDIPHYEMLKKK